ncbi:MAG: hypothetical protein ACTSRG_12945 [Candidatus Helarchaeota archaeon]
MKQAKFKHEHVIETKDGFFTVNAIVIYPEAIDYTVIKNGQKKNIPEDQVIAAYEEIKGSKKRIGNKKTKKPNKKSSKKITKKNPNNNNNNSLNDTGSISAKGDKTNLEN